MRLRFYQTFALALATVAVVAGGCGQSRPVEEVPLFDEVLDPALSAPVDVVRDDWGIPHIYGETLGDVAFAECYMMARDRMAQMDLVRRAAGGSIAYLAGELAPTQIDRDIRMRVHHMARTAAESWAQLQASTRDDDKLLVEALSKCTLGINRYITELQDGRYHTPGALLAVYPPLGIQPWKEADSILVGLFIAFNLSFSADEEINATRVVAEADRIFDRGGTPELVARRGIAQDLLSLKPIVPVYTFPGDLANLSPRSAELASRAAGLGPLLEAASATVRGLGYHHDGFARGSNNWVVGPSLTASGRVIVANDPHLSLDNPATFYMVHLVARGGALPLDVMGAQFPGAPGVILGMNRRLAWAATTSNLDVTDVYQETIVPCDGDPQAPCALWKGQKVPLTAREEVIEVGRPGQVTGSVKVTLWDVPHHGPIIPRIGPNHTVEPLGSQELSIRWTGYEPTNLLRAVLGLNRARSVDEAARALERDFEVGGQNWVLGDVDGHFGWTQAVRVPRRPAGTRPWMVLPGDGSADWLDDLPQSYIPHAFDPATGFLATANADPVGVTDDGDPTSSAAIVDGVPAYIGAYWDAGTRVGRITERIQEMVASGKKITPEDMAALQDDHVAIWNRLLVPTMLAAGDALAQEIAAPGTHPDLSSIANTASPPAKAALASALAKVRAYDFDTRADSVAATLVNVWITRFALLAFEDELEVLGLGVDSQQRLKLLVRMCTAPETLATGLSSTGDSILFDDLNTPEVEGKRLQAAKGILDMLNYLIPVLGPDLETWRWGRLHTLTLEGLLPLPALRIPQKSEAGREAGFPRPGGNGTVDVGNHGLAVDDFSYSAGPVLRAVYELHPAGPKAVNALPGGEIFDPDSPHYRDLLEKWVVNERYPMIVDEAEVAQAARREAAANGERLAGRLRFRRP
jgi:penicillin amidase